MRGVVCVASSHPVTVVLPAQSERVAPGSRNATPASANSAGPSPPTSTCPRPTLGPPTGTVILNEARIAACLLLQSFFPCSSGGSRAQDRTGAGTGTLGQA